MGYCLLACIPLCEPCLPVSCRFVYIPTSLKLNLVNGIISTIFLHKANDGFGKTDICF